MNLALQSLRAAITHDWESIDQVLREHSEKDFGHPHIAGTALWHLRHMLEIFRIHCAAATKGEVVCEGDTPQDPRAVRDLLLAHVEDFIAWVERQPARRLARNICYGQHMSMPAMIGIMSRHITWHSAAMHYWFKWKAGEGQPAPPPAS